MAQISPRSRIPDWVSTLKDSGSEGPEILERERAKSDVSVDTLADFLFTREILNKKQNILALLEAEPIFNKSQNYHLGPNEKLEVAIARGKRLRQLSAQNEWSEDEYQLAVELISEPDPYGLHTSLFLVTLREQGTSEQHEKFLEKAERDEYIGCYAQTELGHGSNVRGLETTATWDADSKTFVLHTPTLTASKWWIGSLSKMANHAIVMAQLVIGGTSYGPHPFIVQIRDLKTHEALPSVCVGDVGPKFGYNTMDTGFLLFNNLRIPLSHMLARFSSVNPSTNEYVRQGSPVSVYATMTYVRSVIVQRAGSALARGVTIATRYCAVRRQFTDLESLSRGEVQVLDYTSVQIRLLPLLASTFALHLTGKGMIGLYKASRGAASNEKLSDLHATSCGLKALASTLAAEGLETCRRACGGHGYSSFSGLGSWYADYLPATTWEGDNYMITQQVARYLLKSARSVLKGDATKNDTTDILSKFVQTRETGAATLNIMGGGEQLVQAFGWRTAYFTFQALKHRDEEKRSWNSLLVDVLRLSTAHSEYLVIKYFYDALSGPNTEECLEKESLSTIHVLFRLFALHTIESRALEFLTASAATVQQIEEARASTVPQLMKEIRPHALRLVDCWSFPDWVLDSSLGRYDGKVYKDLFERASVGNPRNEKIFDPYPHSGVLVKEGE
ncbi:MAG: hypothetical protein Q9217_001097 [Psora testacea]